MTGCQWDCETQHALTRQHSSVARTLSLCRMSMPHRAAVWCGAMTQPLPNVLLPLLASIVSFVFAAMVLRQWRRRRRTFQLVWALGLTWYGLSSAAQALGSAPG